jgi:hypothetical protein
MSKNISNGQPLQDLLHYNEMSMGASGSVMDRAEKSVLRERFGYCKTCEGRPVQLYIIKKSRLNPLWVNKDPTTILGKSLEGKCLVCYPKLDPNPRQRHRIRSARQLEGTKNNSNRRNNSDDQQRAAVSSCQPAHQPAHQPAPPASVARQLERTKNNSNRRNNSDHSEDQRAAVSSSQPAHQPAPPSGVRKARPVVQNIPSQRSNSAQNLSSGSLGLRASLDYSPPSKPNKSQSARKLKFFSNVYIPDSVRDLGLADQQRQEHAPARSDASIDMPADEGLLHLLEIASEEDDLEQMFTRYRHFDQPPLVITPSERSHTSSDASRESALSNRNMQAHLITSSDRSNASSNSRDSALSNRNMPYYMEHDAIVEPVVVSSPSSNPPVRDMTNRVQQHELFHPTCAVNFPQDGTLRNIVPPAPVSGASSRGADEQMSLPPFVAAVSNGEGGTGDHQIDEIIHGLSILVTDMMAAGGGSGFLVEVVLLSMREHARQERVQIYCLQAICDICKDDNQDNATIMSSGAPEDIVRAMKDFPVSSVVQEKGTSAIWSLGVSTNNRIILVRAGACERIVKAMENYSWHESLVRTAIGALRTLSPEIEAREAFKPLQASKHTARAMELNRSSVSIQRDGCAFVSNCAVNIERQYVAVVPFEELDAVVQAMASHREELSVMSSACFALKNYTYEEKNCRALRQCKGIEELMDHAFNFERSATCPLDASDAMERMQLSRAADDAIEDHAQTSLFSTVDSQGVTAQTSRTIVEFMHTYDWSPKLVSAGIQCLRLCTEHVSQKNRILEAKGVIRDIVRFIEKYERNADVVEKGCRLLALLGSDEARTQTALIEAGACNVIFCALTRHLDDQQVVVAALTALAPLSSNFDCWSETGGQSKVQMVADAIAAHPTCENLQMIGAAVMSYLDFFH